MSLKSLMTASAKRQNPSFPDDGKDLGALGPCHIVEPSKVSQQCR
jgi:hypothetical protein